MRWTIKPKPEQEAIDQLSEALGVENLVAQLLIQRGITNFEEAKAFFRPELTHLHDPFLMKDMDKAVQRIEQAIAKGENMLVYGDYDVDGTTSVALMSSFLMETYPNVATYIPDRYLEGYGISFQGIDFAADNDVSLMIALDCGIKAIDQIKYAKEKGIDVIVCDHHRPGQQLPEAVAVLDPKQEDCEYPYKELCGCGVGFKLIQALASKQGKTIKDLMPYLDLVATAIAADIVPITGENRVLAHYGLQVINEHPRTGIKALIDQTKKRELTITDVVFIIAPRINAAGRMKHGQHAVTLLSEANFAQAQQYAAEIELFNTERRSLDQEITQEALVQIQENQEEDKFTSVVYNENWHKGVIGIVASRLTETYYRPTLVFTKSGDKLAASARSVKGFDIYNALEGCSDCLEQFGGHMYAAGLTLLEEQYEAFKNQFEKVVSETIDPKLLQPEITVDTKIAMHQITPKLMRILKQFAPFGPGNMTPIFMAEGLKDTGYARGVGEDEKHLKCSVYQPGSNPIGAIGFNLGDKLNVVKRIKPFDAVFSLDENEWNGTVSLQLKLRDIR
ncbi:MAG: single-stranded-DNA-specific exonuclease RecJ [Muricauda sp.]|jgi:single-stranded-DNA-specific exonuclease|nr:single-stranded-DNA-specific exonuclease RecJ [Allomuricauda sp.]MBO6532428.1 single-stranded-DNA-specific exonuclease RecJ [Allomuricauda sp.]MBO6587917.1 single-stranded-DNA-specific exonuclease RecJ [Allomuricauda sp.]MBO6617542.1 single-stranded-DNA-specific exonuclease RecJ [Allomuricauda sp.]MBO6643447.1 single-stranded-DNA-specific exonuclease RecJ [Allomuricauda sp.]MBO6745877.1 single-stranded-DNA-specific exonuclease RecJ [Allomuricauda sp.]